jgi:hypothetical protein
MILFIYQEHEFAYLLEKGTFSLLNADSKPENISLDEGLEYQALQKDQDQDGEADNDITEGLTIEK